MRTIVKRSGEQVPFDPMKIQLAMEAAGLSRPSAERLVPRVVRRLTDGDSVETIQDRVEQVLMADGTYDIARSYILYRAARTRYRNRSRSPDGTILSDYIQVPKYSRFREDLGRRETYEESVNRLMLMHIARYPNMEHRIRSVFNDFVLTKRVLPSMRSLQFGGHAIEVNNARMFNCSFTHVDRMEVFSQIFWLLLSGCGVGFSVQECHVRSLPRVLSLDSGRSNFHIIHDSIEGWGNAVHSLFLSYMSDGVHVEFDYELIRPVGSELKTSGGKAPGHLPLRHAIESIRGILNQAANRRLRPIECHDIICILAQAVLAGGIRRSSLISIFSPEDSEMMSAKTGDWFGRTPWRAMANNSALFLHGVHDAALFADVFENNRQFGDPGFMFAESADYGCNPCGEIGLHPNMLGVSAIAFCNLTEINGALVRTPKDLLSAAHAAAFIGTLQAGYTSFPFLGRATEELAECSALLGVSITGIMDSKVCRSTEHLESAVYVVREVNAVVSAEIGIKPAMRMTTVKPSGTASLLLGSVGSGIHPHHARRYIRRVTANPLEPAFIHFRSINPHACVRKPNGDWVIEFPVEAPEGSITKDQMTGIQFMDEVFKIYRAWIAPGTRIRSMEKSPGLTHNASCTVLVKDDEWTRVPNYAWEQRKNIQAMSFIPDDDTIYPFAPLEAVRTPAQDEHWLSLVAGMKRIDWSTFYEQEDTTDVRATPACEGPSCEVPNAIDS